MSGPGDGVCPPDTGGESRQRKHLELEEQVLEVLARWDRRLEVASAAWGELSDLRAIPSRARSRSRPFGSQVC